MNKKHLILFGAAAVAGYLLADKLAAHQPFTKVSEFGAQAAG